jgi:hypothetical protein
VLPLLLLLRQAAGAEMNALDFLEMWGMFDT